jgi:hypothetical protein
MTSTIWFSGEINPQQALSLVEVNEKIPHRQAKPMRDSESTRFVLG